MGTRSGNLLTKIHNNRGEIAGGRRGALVYLRRLAHGSTETETMAAMQQPVALRVSTEKREAVLDYLLQFNELATRLGSKLSGDWALSALRTALLSHGAEVANTSRPRSSPSTIQQTTPTTTCLA